MAISAGLRRAGAIARRDVDIERSYPLRILIYYGRTVVGILISYQTSLLVTDTPRLAEWDGNYFDFLMIGFAMMSIAELGISSLNNAIHREMSYGTLEVLLATPTPMWALLSGSMVVRAVLATTEIGFFIGFGMGVLGEGVPLVGLLWAIPLMLLTLLSFCAFGIVGASFVLLTKRADPVTLLVGLASSVLAGALVPVSTFPQLLQDIARAFPAYYGIRGTRLALLSDAGFGDLSPHLVALLAFNIVMLPCAVWVFQRAVAAASTAGTLGSY